MSKLRQRIFFGRCAITFWRHRMTCPNHREPSVYDSGYWRLHAHRKRQPFLGPTNLAIYFNKFLLFVWMWNEKKVSFLNRYHKRFLLWKWTNHILFLYRWPFGAELSPRFSLSLYRWPFGVDIAICKNKWRSTLFLPLLKYTFYAELSADHVQNSYNHYWFVTLN